MSNEEKRCPLCAEEMDWTDQQFKPCKCGYQVCVWCWHQIMDMAEKDESEGRCPACRSAYEKDKIVAMQTDCERAVTKNCNKKSKPPKTKPKTTEVKKDLTNVRVIQRKMAYIVGLPLSLADENVLQQKEYFGQYGKIMKISLSRSSSGDIQQFPNETCSVYVTYSKEEEALRCIRSVHGFVLEGRFLRASFGTAKYCHAWLRSTPCINPACLYLHTIGPEEDSFGKDEIAAVHTRNRVQQIVGATDNVQRRSGNILPSPEEESSNGSSSFLNIVTFMTSSSDSAHIGDLTGNVGAPNTRTYSVDDSRRADNYCADKDIVKYDDRRLLNLSADLSKTKLKEDTQFSDAYSISMSDSLPFSSARSHDNSNLKEFSDDLFEENVLHHEDTLAKDPAKISEDSSSPSVFDERNYSSSNSIIDQNSVHSHKDDSSVPFTFVNLVLNDRNNELKFQSSAKSDRIYRSSNSFSNEEIVEHLLRNDDNDLTKLQEISSFGAAESSIISNVLTKGYVSSDDPAALPRGLSEVLDERDDQHRSSWNLYTGGKSGLSFAKEDGFVDKLSTHRSSINNVGQVTINCSGGKDYGCNLDGYLSSPHYQAPTSPSLAPPGFSLPCRVAPPGFSTFEKTGRVQNSPRGGLIKNPSFPNGFRHSPSIENIDMNGEIDLIDPAILSCGKPTNRLENPSFGTRPSSFNSQLSSLDEEANYFRNFLQPIQSTHKESAAAHIPMRGGDGLSNLDGGLYGYPPRLVHQSQTYDPSSLMQTSQLKLGSGLAKYISGYGDLVFQMAGGPGDLYNQPFNM